MCLHVYAHVYVLVYVSIHIPIRNDLVSSVEVIMTCSLFNECPKSSTRPRATYNAPITSQLCTVCVLGSTTQSYIELSSNPHFMVDAVLLKIVQLFLPVTPEWYVHGFNTTFLGPCGLGPSSQQLLQAATGGRRTLSSVNKLKLSPVRSQRTTKLLLPKPPSSQSTSGLVGALVVTHSPFASTYCCPNHPHRLICFLVISPFLLSFSQCLLVTSPWPPANLTRPTFLSSPVEQLYRAEACPPQCKILIAFPSTLPL